MSNSINFPLNEQKKFSIVVPDISTKFNYYYEPTENLHKFDQARVYFINGKKKIKLENESLSDELYSLHGALKDSIQQKLQLPKSIKSREIGISLNFYLNDLIDIPLESFWVWSGNNPRFSTLMYNADNKIYIEIVPVYPWTFRQHEGEDFIPFEQWMKNYKPYAVETISPLTAMQWLQKSEEYLKLIECEL